MYKFRYIDVANSVLSTSQFVHLSNVHFEKQFCTLRVTTLLV